MKVSIKERLSFIHCDGLRVFDIKSINGIYVLTAKKFKQNLKQSEYEKIMAVSVLDRKETAKERKEREKDEKAIKAQEAKEANPGGSGDSMPI